MNLMERRRALMGAQEKKKKLPDEYQEVEYLSKNSASSADIYIPTNISIPQQYPIIFCGKFYPIAFGTRDGYSVGLDRRNNSTPSFSVGLKNGINIYNGGSSSQVTLVSVSTTNKIVEFAVEVTANSVSFNGTIDGQSYIATSEFTPITWNSNDKVFISSDYGNSSMKGYYYYAKVIQQGQTKADLVPCYRISDNKLGMYDLVSKSFKPVTGAWTKGADV